MIQNDLENRPKSDNSQRRITLKEQALLPEGITLVVARESILTFLTSKGLVGKTLSITGLHASGTEEQLSQVFGGGIPEELAQYVSSVYQPTRPDRF